MEKEYIKKLIKKRMVLLLKLNVFGGEAYENLSRVQRIKRSSFIPEMSSISDLRIKAFHTYSKNLISKNRGTRDSNWNDLRQTVLKYRENLANMKVFETMAAKVETDTVKNQTSAMERVFEISRKLETVANNINDEKRMGKDFKEGSDEKKKSDAKLEAMKGYVENYKNKINEINTTHADEPLTDEMHNGFKKYADEVTSSVNIEDSTARTNAIKAAESHKFAIFKDAATFKGVEKANCVNHETYVGGDAQDDFKNGNYISLLNGSEESNRILAQFWSDNREDMNRKEFATMLALNSAIGEGKADSATKLKYVNLQEAFRVNDMTKIGRISEGVKNKYVAKASSNLQKADPNGGAAYQEGTFYKLLSSDAFQVLTPSQQSAAIRSMTAQTGYNLDTLGLDSQKRSSATANYGSILGEEPTP